MMKFFLLFSCFLLSDAVAADKAYYPPSKAASNRAALNDVYNPEPKAGDSQAAMDAIKKRYEDILVNYLFLKKCKRAHKEDYYIILSALAQEMASVNAPGRLLYDIQTAAQGSYKEIYAQSRCEGIDALYTQYGDYIKALAANVGMP